MASKNSFTWVETHRGIVEYLKDKEDQQEELIALLKSAGATLFNDQDPKDNRIDLTVIDPFSFFSYIYKYGVKRRLNILQNIAKRLNLPVPNDVNGLPTSNAQNVWFFAYKYERINNEIQRLWKFFDLATNEKIENEGFADVLGIAMVGYAKITEGLFYIDPINYLPINVQTTSYLENKFDINPEFTTYSEYDQLLQKVRSKIKDPFYKISYDAYLWNTRRKKTSYWILQGNPNRYDFEEGVREGIIERYSIREFETPPSPGDKAILTVSGDRAGVYGLGKVTSDPYKVEDELKVDIEIIKSIADNPILKDESTDFNLEQDYKVDMQGSSFYSDKEQYKKVKKYMEERDYDSEEDVEFHEIKSQFSEEDLETYFSFLRELINMLDLKRGDRRIVLGCKRSRLNFMIGQRYCWNMFPKYKGGKFGVISMERLNENSKAYEGTPPQPYYTYSHKFSPSSEDMQSILEGMRFELDRTNKSGLLKYHNKEFEDYIFSDHADSSIKKLKNPYLNQNLNTILYGPPGTGKTYHTSDLAVQIIEPDEYKAGNHSHNKNRFDELVKQGKVVFTTFHQSTSYEDFIEGIKPVMADNKEEEEKGDIRYKIESGVFKKLIEKIEDRKKLKKQDAPSFQISEKKFNQPVNKVSLGDSTLEEDEAIYEYCIKNDCIAIGFGEDIDFTGVQDTTDIRERYKKAGIEVESANDYNVYAIQRLILWMKPGQLVMVSNGNKKLRAIGEVSGDYYFDKDSPIRYSQFRKVKWLYPDIDIPIKEIYPKQFSQQTIYQMDGNAFDIDFFTKEKKSIAPDDEKFVMIIDEINRGNIAQIFGELITLLEEDKRDGAANSLSVKLPYSKTIFTIPSNLYIIGTMNTADRSVEALDTALRRRFAFEEMMPQPAIIEEVLQHKNVWESIRISDVLATINQRIETLVDRDHLIGHSYFLSLKEVAPEEMENALIHVFEDKIVPLLQEYFYNDYVKIGMVLGRGFIDIKKSQTLTFADFEESLDTDYTEKKLYHIYSRKELKENGFRSALQHLLNETSTS